MPGFIKNKVDEKKWVRAKKAAGNDSSGKTNWALSTYIFKRMKSKAQDKKA